MNESWDEGYTSETAYTYGYYNQLNPLQLKLNFLAKSVAMPKIKTACELGFGQGISINIHAAASDIEWYGNDFNPEQVAFAKHLAEDSGAKIHLYDDSFEEFVNRDDLPEFDYIAIHGIWSWISDENKHHIVDFVKKKLKVGGVLYISYNTLPGHCKNQPLRELMSLYDTHCVPRVLNIKDRVDESLNFVEEVCKLSPAFTSDCPKIFDKIKSLRPEDHTYLCHEYLNQNWDPMYFHQFAKFIEPAKLNYVCSTSIAENMDIVNFNDQHRELFSVVNNPILEETMKDFLLNRQFRCDVWVKGARHLNMTEQEAAAREIDIIFTGERESVKMEYNGYCAAINLTNILNPMLDILDDHKSHSVDELLNKTFSLGFTLNDSLFAIQSLAAQNVIALTQDVTDEIVKQSQNLNKSIVESCVLGARLQNIACPITGGALAFDHLSQLFLLAYITIGKDITADKVCDFIESKFALNDLKVIKAGVTLENSANNREEIYKEAEKFLSKLDFYRTLRVID